MTYVAIIIALFTGAVAGLLAGLLLGQRKRALAEADNARLAATIDTQAKAAADTLQTQKTHYEETIKAQEARHTEAVAAQKTRYNETIALQRAHYEQMMQAQQKRFDETLQRTTAEMKLSTDEMLKARQKEFAETSTQNISQIVTPLKESLHKMMKQSELTMRSADELTRVLHHGSKMQGDWGEAILDELLESQGLTRGIHYDLQTTIRNADGDAVRNDSGSTMRPDVILHLDHQREVIIDSKVSLTAFFDYVNADNEADRQQYLRAHVESLEQHVRELSHKDYSAYIQPPKVRMDYVIMFVPNTGALWTALRGHSDLWRKAMEKGVFIADEQTLFAALRIVAMTWKQIEQAENQQRVFSLANEMIDRVGQFYKRYTAIGKAIENAQKAYDEGNMKMQPSGQSILQTCNKLIKLGARQSTVNPLPQIESTDAE